MDYRIAWMFPDTLFMHGERGNVEALKRYSKLMGYNALVDRIDFDTTEFNPDTYDVIVFGVGEISSFSAIINWIRKYDASLRKYVDSGRPMLVTGTSQAMFASEIVREDGSVIEGLNYFPAKVTERTYVYGDDIIANCKYNNKELEIVGSQIMMMDINATDNCQHFGTLEYGYGNNGKNRDEGFNINNAIFTNILGPMLVCNPWLTVEIIKASANYKGDKIKQIDETFSLERNSAEAKKKFNFNKATNLTNCKL